MIKKLGLLAVAALLPYVGVAGQPTQTNSVGINGNDVPAGGKPSLRDRLITRSNMISSDKATACAGLERDYNVRDMSMDQIALNLMVACGYDVADRLKLDISSGETKAVHFALETWNTYLSSSIFQSSDFDEFIVRYLVQAPSISTWSNDNDLRYYLAVRGVIRSGGIEQLRQALASRPDYDHFDDFLRWSENLEAWYKAVVIVD
jgi:hypothetical protein